MTNLPQLQELLNIPKDITITSHRNPDGDAIGSSLALYHFLVKNGHHVKVIFPSEYPAFVAWMPGADNILIHDIEPDDCEAALKSSDFIFCLDYNSLSRVDKMGDYIESLEHKELVMIDHHLFPDIQSDYIYSKPEASSTCEMIYDFIHMLDKGKDIDVDIAEAILTGILTDTGSFKYNTTSHLFKVVAGLIDLGADDYKVQDLIFNSMTEKQLRLLGHCLNKRMEILDEYNTGIITLSRKDYEYFDIQRGDTEGVVNFLLKMKHIRMAAFITEQPTVVKLSLRSKGDISVQEIATKHFKGGGHKNASGGYSFSGLRATVKKFKEILPEFKEMLTSK